MDQKIFIKMGSLYETLRGSTFENVSVFFIIK